MMDTSCCELTELAMTLNTLPMTAEEFDKFTQLPENADKHFEFIGEGIFEVPSNPYVSYLAGLIHTEINIYLKSNKIGYATGEADGYMVSGERYAPDIAYISKEKQPKLAKQGYNPNPPDLAVEVLSPSNSDREVRIKVVNYLRAGTLVWVVNPDDKLVEVYAPDNKPITLDESDTLSGSHVLPGFEMPVKLIFEEIEE